MSAPSAENDARRWPHVHCRRTEAHKPHTHVNEGPHGGCGLPEWCDGTRDLPPGEGNPS